MMQLSKLSTEISNLDIGLIKKTTDPEYVLYPGSKKWVKSILKESAMIAI